jgi:putative oxidoreductase
MFFQGAWWRVFELGPIEHARRFFVEPYASTLLPEWTLWIAGVGIPFSELIGGALVLVGLWRPWGLIVLGCVLVTVTFGHLVAEPLYAFDAHVFPRLVLLLFLMTIPPSWDAMSVDEWRRGRARTGTPRAPTAHTSGGG